MIVLYGESFLGLEMSSLSAIDISWTLPIIVGLSLLQDFRFYLPFISTLIKHQCYNAKANIEGHETWTTMYLMDSLSRRKTVTLKQCCSANPRTMSCTAVLL